VAFIETVGDDEATADVSELYEADRARLGYVPNYTRVFASFSKTLDALARCPIRRTTASSRTFARRSWWGGRSPRVEQQLVRPVCLDRSDQACNPVQPLPGRTVSP